MWVVCLLSFLLVSPTRISLCWPSFLLKQCPHCCYAWLSSLGDVGISLLTHFLFVWVMMISFYTLTYQLTLHTSSIPFGFLFVYFFKTSNNIHTSIHTYIHPLESFPLLLHCQTTFFKPIIIIVSPLFSSPP